jgi:geranylgeranyl diphosphate synthase type II
LASEFGREIGLAFQIADDVLNETSTAEQLGKAVGSDRERSKLTYPALLGLEESRHRADESMGRALTLLNQFPGDTEALGELAKYAVVRTW